MRKNITVLLLAFTLISGCGGGDTSTGDSPKGGGDNHSNLEQGKGRTDGKYKLWDYIVPKTDTTNNFIETKGGETNSYKTTYSIASSTVTEISDYAKDEKTIYTKKADRITVSFTKDDTPNGSYDLHLTANLKDSVTIKEATCKLIEHHASIKINEKTFTDVIEIQCSDKPGYYQRDVGEVAQTKLGSNSSRSVRVLSN